MKSAGYLIARKREAAGDRVKIWGKAIENGGIFYVAVYQPLADAG